MVVLKNDDYEDATNIHVFDISDPDQLYPASGRVLGTVQDQFSISEYDGAIRVASTTDAWGRWWMTDQIDQETGTTPLQDLPIVIYSHQMNLGIPRSAWSIT